MSYSRCSLISLLLFIIAVFTFVIPAMLGSSSVLFVVLIVFCILIASLSFAIKSVKRKKTVGGFILLFINGVVILFFTYAISAATYYTFTEDPEEDELEEVASVSEQPEQRSRIIWMDQLPQELTDMAANESGEYLERVLRENKKAVKSESGLIYEILKPGNKVRSASSKDVYVMEWEMLSRSGERALSLDNPEGARFNRETTLEKMMPGMAEGVQLIGEGGSIKLYIPQHLIYKTEQADIPQVGKEIIFLVNLIEIRKANAEDNPAE